MVNFAKSALEAYPRTCLYLQTTLPRLVADAPGVWGEFLGISGLSEAGARQACEPAGTYPQIFFRDLDRYDGLFRPSAPHAIELNRLIAERFEAAAEDAATQRFLLAKTLHEMVHWALHPNEPVRAERGVAFEVAAFGTYVNRPWEVAGQPLAASRIEEITDHAATPSRLLDPPASIPLTKDLPRGIRNRNPGNIRVGASWFGLAEFEEMTDFQRAETAFCVFSEDKWGLRAMARLLRRYQDHHGLTTVEAMIGRWAPPSENKTAAYAAYVGERIGVAPTARIDFSDAAVAVPMIAAMTRLENGQQPYSDAIIEEGIALSAASM